MGRSTPSWIQRGVHPSHATVLRATVLHAIAAPVRQQCAQAGDVAVKAHRSALRANDAPICSRSTGSSERCVRASLVSDFVLDRSK